MYLVRSTLEVISNLRFVAAGHSELEVFIRYGQPGGEKTGDALIALRTGEKVTALARIEARPGKPPAIRVN